MIKGIIFDLDGVIVSTDHYHYQAWKALADREGIYFDKVINNRLRGVSRRESLMIILEKSQRKYEESEIDEMLNYKNTIYRNSLNKLTKIDILPGIIELLEYLESKNIKKAIGSSSKNTMIILDRIGLKDRFDYIVDGTMITNTKPDPEVFIKVRLGLGLQTDECLVVEDALAGVMASHNADIKAVAVGDAAKNKAGDYNLDNALDLIKILDDKGVE